MLPPIESTEKEKCTSDFIHNIEESIKFHFIAERSVMLELFEILF